jgi:hypothetical protein
LAKVCFTEVVEWIEVNSQVFKERRASEANESNVIELGDDEEAGGENTKNVVVAPYAIVPVVGDQPDPSI